MNEYLVLIDAGAPTNGPPPRRLIVGGDLDPTAGLEVSLGPEGPQNPVHLDELQVAHLFEHLRGVLDRNAQREKEDA